MNALYVPIALYDATSSCYRHMLFDDLVDLDLLYMFDIDVIDLILC